MHDGGFAAGVHGMKDWSLFIANENRAPTRFDNAEMNLVQSRQVDFVRDAAKGDTHGLLAENGDRG